MIRYDTFVVKNCTSPTMPEEIAGGKVVVWAEGDMLHRLHAFEEFVEKIANEEFDDPVKAADQFLEEAKYKETHDE